MIAQYLILSHLLFPAQNFYLESSVFRKNEIKKKINQILCKSRNVGYLVIKGTFDNFRKLGYVT